MRTYQMIQMAAAIVFAAALAPITSTAADAKKPNPDVAAVVATGKPATAPQTVLAAKNAGIATGAKVALTGRVKDFVDGQAVFTIVDPTVKHCKEHGEDCPTPWDYCCTPKGELTSATATVKVVGAAGGTRALPGTAQGAGGLDHLQDVTVEGQAQRDKRGNLTVFAEKVTIGK